MNDPGGFDPSALEVDEVKVNVYSAIHTVCDVRVELTESIRFEEDLQTDESVKRKVLREVGERLNISFNDSQEKDVRTVGDMVEAAKALQGR
ncbi:hypothetical protein ACGFSG_26230 [Streptomyces sp. NPDC048512]|uniref:hypothetical protein n=1 Tax=unclassified Streptomyces TaxID=2593676 RepID=UPI0009BECCE2|nr:hypothetical protein [Streptomyces sp. M41(2017)]OQQ13775.1 hypothetical protein B0675_26365 [Streptomyces sp. M41(2017)]